MKLRLSVIYSSATRTGTSEEFVFNEDNANAITIVQQVSDKYEALGIHIEHGGDEDTYEFQCIDTSEQPAEALAISFYDELRSELHKAGF